MEVAVMILGGTAAACGIVPPFTQVLRAVGMSGTNITGVTMPDLPSITGQWNNPVAGFDYILRTLTGANAPTPNPSAMSEEDARKYALSVGLFCSGAIEAVFTLRFVSNVEALKGLLKLPGEVLHGIGEIIPG